MKSHINIFYILTLFITIIPYVFSKKRNNNNNNNGNEYYLYLNG